MPPYALPRDTLHEALSEACRDNERHFGEPVHSMPDFCNMEARAEWTLGQIQDALDRNEPNPELHLYIASMGCIQSPGCPSGGTGEE